MQKLSPAARRYLGLGLVVAVVLLLGTVPATANPGGTGLVISQVYGGGGNTGAQYTNDFIEIFNPTAAPSLSPAGRCSTPATAGTPGTNRPTSTGDVPPGQLLPRAGGAPGRHAGARPADARCDRRDRHGRTAGKVALVNTTSALTAGCPLATDRSSTSSATARPRTAPRRRRLPTLTNSTAASAATAAAPTPTSTAPTSRPPAPAPRNSSSPTTTCPCRRHDPLDQRRLAERGQRRHDDASPSPSASRRRREPAASPSTSRPPTARAGQPGDYAAKSLTGPDDRGRQHDLHLRRPRQRRHGRRAGRDLLRQRHERHRRDRRRRPGTGNDRQRRRRCVRRPVHADLHDPGQRRCRPITGIVTHPRRRRRRLRGPDLGGLQGFYIQDPTGDGNTATSDGIFVFTGNTTTT